MTRAVSSIIPAIDTADGDGVKLRRSLGATLSVRHDPFLMLDEIMSDQAADYIGGFPPHPHRGFETVTYMLEGSMQHKDHMGNIGLLQPGGAQWMTAGRGIIHEEMPQQDGGRLHGFQLWLNLASDEKMKPAYYRDIAPSEIPQANSNGFTMRLIAGSQTVAGERLQGPINTPEQSVTTDPLMADISIETGGSATLAIKQGHNALLYVFKGEINVAGQIIKAPAAAVLTDGDQLTLESADGGRCLLLAGRPIGEPIAQRGPFVMNTQEELYQAMKDYGNGTLTG